MLVEVIGTRFGNVTPSDRCPRSAEIMDQVTSLGGRQVIQEEGDCWGFYFREEGEEGWVGKVKQTRRVIYHDVERSQVVEDSRRNGGICVDDGANTEEVGDYWIDGDRLLEVSCNSGCIIASREGCPACREFAYCRKGGFMEDQRR